MLSLNLINVDGNINLPKFNFFRKKKHTEKTVNILFIDDQDMPVVSSLKKAGYRVKKVKDISDINDADVTGSDIFFVDYEGVGLSISLKHQGVGLARELKHKFGDKKYVALYTGLQGMPTDTTMSEFFNVLDARMKKDADVTEFIDRIRDAVKKLK